MDHEMRERWGVRGRNGGGRVRVVGMLSLCARAQPWADDSTWWRVVGVGRALAELLLGLVVGLGSLVRIRRRGKGDVGQARTAVSPFTRPRSSGSNEAIFAGDDKHAELIAKSAQIHRPTVIARTSIPRVSRHPERRDYHRSRVTGRDYPRRQGPCGG